MESREVLLDKLKAAPDRAIADQRTTGQYRGRG